MRRILLVLTALTLSTEASAQFIWDQESRAATPLPNAKADCVNRAVQMDLVYNEDLADAFYRNCMFHHGYKRRPRPGVVEDYFPPAPRKM